MRDNQNHTAIQASQADAIRKAYAPPRLSTFGAVCDLTASGSGTKSELGAPGKGLHLTRRG